MDSRPINTLIVRGGHCRSSNESHIKRSIHIHFAFLTKMAGHVKIQYIAGRLWMVDQTHTINFVIAFELWKAQWKKHPESMVSGITDKEIVEN